MADAADRWMTLAEAADYLQLSKAKVYVMARRGEIPCTRVAGRWRFKREQVDEWMLVLAARGSAPPGGVSPPGTSQKLEVPETHVAPRTVGSRGRKGTKRRGP